MRFKPGKSGNPGGRKRKTAAVREAEEMYREMAPLAASRVREILEANDKRGWPKAISIVNEVAGVGVPEDFPTDLAEWDISHFYKAREIADQKIAEHEAQQGKEVH